VRLSIHVEALRRDLEAAAAVGDERAAEIGERLADAATRSASLRFLDVLGDALLEANAQLPAGQLELRLAGTDPSVVFVEEETAAPSAPDEPSAARLTLRLPDSLKAQIEAAAAREGVSVNTWLVRALARAVAHPQQQRSGRRLVGYGRT
jgi:predicted HicB family RNase H-like nuclease